MRPKQFNKLSSREKWDNLDKVKGNWYCPHCRAQIDKPYRPSPFHAASIHCGNCDFELSRRTGGGQCDPFRWHLGKIYPPPLTSLPNGTLVRYRKKLYSLQMGLNQRLIVDVNDGIWRFLEETRWRSYEVVYNPRRSISWEFT